MPTPLTVYGPREQLRASGCPYSTVHVAIASNGSRRDWQIAERVRSAYSTSLSDAGFNVVKAPEQAYWSAFSLVSVSGRVDSIFAWSVYVMATHDIAGELQTPLRFAVQGDDPVDLSGFMFLKEVRLTDLDRQVRAAGEHTAGALLTPAMNMCVAWTEDEEIREALSEEIIRVRDRRIRKSLSLGIEGASNN
jgi:hypothetical protein